MITYQGAKMSKSKGNTISPSTYRRALRRRHRALLHPVPRAARPGRRLVRRRRRRGAPLPQPRVAAAAGGAATRSSRRRRTIARAAPRSTLARKAHWAIAKVTGDIERFQFNTALAALMELVNEIYRVESELRDGERRRARPGVRDRDRRVAAVPVRAAPVLRGVRADDRRAGVGGAVARGRSRALLERDTVNVVIQVNGKVRDSVEVDAAHGRGRAEARRARAPEGAAPSGRPQGRA